MSATAYERVLDALRSTGHEVTDRNGTARTGCPAHNGSSETSLMVTRIDGSVLIHCYAGCGTDDVLAATKLTKADLYDDRKGATYEYPDGRLVHRSPTKEFRQSKAKGCTALFHADRIGDADTVYVTEGEKDVLAIESADGTAVCSAMGAGKAHLFDWTPLKGKHVVIVHDKDKPGHKHATETAAILDPIAESVRIVEAAVGKDAADHIAAGKTLDEFVYVPSPLLANVKSAAELDEMEFADLVEHVPNLITEGFGIIAGSPKIGKSWLTTGIALVCASGGKAFGSIKVEPRPVLLLALEDGERRLQSRMWKLHGDDPLPEKLNYLTTIEPGEVLPTIKEWLKSHAHEPNPPLVLLDTIGKVRQQRKPGEDPYIADYQMGSEIKRLADAVPGAAILAVHHDRKAASDDWLLSVSGTQGVTGSADYVLLLTRKRKSAEGMLAVTGRDIRENEYALLLTDGVWKLDGGSLDNAAERAEERKETSNLGDRSLDVLSIVLSRKETTPRDVADALDIDNKQAGVYLGRLADAGRIKKLRRGVYTPVLKVESVENSDKESTNSTHTTDTTNPFNRGKVALRTLW